MKRIMIIGSGGAGKSTLALQLGKILPLPVHHLDRLFWHPGWTETPKDEWVEIQQRLCAEPEWIIDGNYGGTMDLRLAACDTVIFLNYSRWRCLWQAMKRLVTYRHRVRPDMTEGCPERVTRDFLRWIWNYPRQRRPGILKKMDALQHTKSVIILRHPRDTKDLINRLTTEPEDHFSAMATGYARGRFGYPESLYRFLAGQCSAHELAWDCASGGGQAARDLATYFPHVIATDISEALLRQLPAQPGMTTRVAPAEASGLGSASVDLITVAQAVHWFDLEQFWHESMRVLKPNGILAMWGYNWPLVNSEVDEILGDLKRELTPYWPAKSAILHQGYRTLQPPMVEIPTPQFDINLTWNLEDYLAHLRSWSSVRYFLEQQHTDIIARYAPLFSNAWGRNPRPVSWSLILRVFRQSR